MPATSPVLVSDRDADVPQVEEATLGTSRSSGSTLSGAKGSVRDLDVSKIKNSVTARTSQLAEVFRDMKAVGDFKLTEVAVLVEVAAEEGLILIGKAGVSGGISLKFEP